jgi:hypothetical protein
VLSGVGDRIGYGGQGRDWGWGRVGAWGWFVRLVSGQGGWSQRDPDEVGAAGWGEFKEKVSVRGGAPR